MIKKNIKGERTRERRDSVGKKKKILKLSLGSVFKRGGNRQRTARFKSTAKQDCVLCKRQKKRVNLAMGCSVNRWGESETMLSLREAERIEIHCIQSLQLDMMDLRRVVSEKKLHQIMAKVMDAVRTTIRRESPAPAGARVEAGWRNPPEPWTPRDNEWEEFRVQRDRDIVHRHYAMQMEWRVEEAARQEEWVPRDAQTGQGRNRQGPSRPPSVVSRGEDSE